MGQAHKPKEREGGVADWALTGQARPVNLTWSSRRGCHVGWGGRGGRAAHRTADGAQRNPANGDEPEWAPGTGSGMARARLARRATAAVCRGSSRGLGDGGGAGNQGVEGGRRLGRHSGGGRSWGTAKRGSGETGDVTQEREGRPAA
uniref:Uncharacterized protein n=1 Tax=Oryza sativa subsp. japonica TaxID=39947 RepID=Q6YY07_ORYSJ|nr:hypothetical protein [Oryza sativa Japonica Group]BAD17493.1 hypothetical protein [Oryza sativa Japonica Group]